VRFDLVGLAARFNRPIRLDDGTSYVFAPGCFAAALRHPTPAHVDHRQVAIAAAADVQLWESAAGLCIGLRLGDTRISQRVRQFVAGGRAKGWSTSWLKREAVIDRWTPPPLRVRTLLQIPRLREISLMIVDEPYDPTTWVMFDGRAARQRLAREEHRVLDAELDDMEAVS